MLNDFAGIQSAWWKWSSFFRIQRIKSVITVKRMTLWIFLHFLHDTNFPFVFGVRFSYSAICFWICFHLLWKILWFGTFIKFIPLLNVCVCVWCSVSVWWCPGYESRETWLINYSVFTNDYGKMGRLKDAAAATAVAGKKLKNVNKNSGRPELKRMIHLSKN